MAFEDLTLKIIGKPKIPEAGGGYGSRRESDPLTILLGKAIIRQELDVASLLTDLQKVPEAEKLIVANGWNQIVLHTATTYYDPAMARKVASRHDGAKLGPISTMLQEKVGIETVRLRAAKRIGLKYVSESPDVDVSWLPEFITKPSHAYVTLAKEQTGEFTAEVRKETVVKRESSVIDRHSYLDVDYDMHTFFDNGHPDLGRPVAVDIALSDEEGAAFYELYTRFSAASQAVIAAAVGENFSVTPVTPNELWQPSI